MTTIFRRFIITTTGPVRWAFRFGDHFQILPPETGMPEVERNGMVTPSRDQPAILEVSAVPDSEGFIASLDPAGELQPVTPEMLDDDATNRAATYVCRLLSALTPYRFRPADTSAGAGWFITYAGSDSRSSYGVRRYWPEPTRITALSASDSPLVGRVPYQAYYAGAGPGISVQLPDIIDTLMSAAYQLREDEAAAFSLHSRSSTTPWT